MTKEFTGPATDQSSGFGRRDVLLAATLAAAGSSPAVAQTGKKVAEGNSAAPTDPLDRYSSFSLSPARIQLVTGEQGLRAATIIEAIEDDETPSARYRISGSNIIAQERGEALSDQASSPARTLDTETAGTMRWRQSVIEQLVVRRQQFLDAFVEALFGTSKLTISIAQIVANANAWVALLPPQAKGEIQSGAKLLEFVLGSDFTKLSIAQRQARIRGRIAEPTFGLLRPLGRLRTIFYASYYQDASCWNSIGFVPPQRRPKAPAFSQVSELKVQQLDPHQECDWLVIGSGAGGAAAAAALVAKGEDVLVIDSGEYWPAKRFAHDDIGQIANIYVGGGLQSSSNRDIAVLQGSCIGGASLINNCIVFRLAEAGWSHPDAEDVLATWRKLGAKVDRARLARSNDWLERRLGVAEITAAQGGSNGAHLLHSWAAFLSGGQGTAADRRAPSRLFRKNYGADVRSCWACGYCNSGCPYHRKNSVCQTLLVDVEAGGGKIVPEVEAVRINYGPAGSTRRARSVDVRFKGKRSKIKIRKGVIVAAGVGASSKLLYDSDIDNAGQRLSCNLACPVIARMPTPVNSWDAVQMASYVDRGDHLIESWFHPPATFSASLGGWFEEYFRRMQSYSQLACLAVLMPVTDMGTVIDGKLNIALNNSDLKRLRRYVKDVVAMHFAGGAEEVYLPSPRGITIRRGDNISDIVDANLQEAHDFILSTAHPQGGNPIGRDASDSVVGSDLRVHGCQNVYVADASVFPTSVRVNPQLTVMALAHSIFANGL